MKEISKRLLQFIKTQFGSKFKTVFKTPIITLKSRTFLRKIYEQVLKADQAWHKNTHNIQENTIRQISANSDDFQKGPAYSYLPAEIKSIIVKSVKYEKTVQFKINSDTYQMVMVYPQLTGGSHRLMTLQSVNRFFETALYKVYLWLYVAEHYASPECSKNMNIHLYFTDHLKVLAKGKMEPLDEIHANTAFTTSCSPSTDIHLFREEEWFKVFIHETFHNLGLDFSGMDNMACNRRILELFPINKEVRLFETYCETWAETIHCVFLAFFSTQTKHYRNWPLVFNKIDELLKYEAIWSAFQCMKVLNHYRLSYSQLTDTKCHLAKNARAKQYKENTFVLSYFVIKAVLMTQPSKFIDWCLDHNGRTLDFKKSSQNLLDYCELVARLYKDPWFTHNYVRIMEEWFRDPGNLTIKQDIEGQTLRMTLFE